jgi:hypothetical protein
MNIAEGPLATHVGTAKVRMKSDKRTKERVRDLMTSWISLNPTQPEAASTIGLEGYTSQ